MAITIRDIARLSDTSVATVSRVLNGKPGVAADRRSRILELSRELGYSPNRSARSLALQRTQVLGFIASDLSNPSYIHFLRAIESMGRERGYQILIADSAQDPEQEQQNVATMIEHRAEGLLIFPVSEYRRESSVDHLLGLRLKRVPFVLFGNIDYPVLDAVHTREEEIGYLLGRHLLEHGHRRLAIAGCAPLSRTVAERCAGVRRAVTEFDHPAQVLCDDAPATEIGGISEPEWHAWWRQCFSRADRPTGIVAINDDVALRLYGPLHDSGLSVPRDVSVASVGNVSWSAYIRPSLTTADASMDERARAGMEVLFARMENPLAPPMVRTLSYRLIARESTGPAPAETQR